MFFAYVDESGDSGYERSPSTYFSLGVILIRDRDWLQALDHVVAFRRYLSREYSIPARAELKAVYLLRGGGALQSLRMSPARRMEVYRWAMLLQRKYKWPTFAVVVRKDAITDKTKTDPRDTAWTYALQRLQRFAKEQDEPIHVLPDSGHGYFIRRKMRSMRRHHMVASRFATSALARPADYLVEDPSERQSHESYFIQLADLNAYAAARVIHPTSRFNAEMWGHLGPCRLHEVNRLRGGPEGIVAWP